MKRLIINADDFGLTPGVNRAIVEAHDHGVVTSATLMAAGAAFGEAVALAARLPRLSVGCHLDLVQLAPVSPPETVPTLVAGGRFRPGFVRFARAALRNRLSTCEIAAEAKAQIRKLQGADLTVSHFDTHKHTHLFPRVLRALIQAAKACGVRALRNPFEPEAIVRFSELALRPKLVSRYCAVRAFHSMAAKFSQAVVSEGMITTDGTVGIVLTGFWDERRLHALIRRLPEGTWELVAHPGYDEPALRPLSVLTASRQTELGLLTSAKTRELLQEHGVQLISYRDLLA